MFPVGDWQFYIVTLVAIGALFLVVRPFWPRRKKPGCGGCGITAPATRPGSAAGDPPSRPRDTER